jgi:FAD/FMN-containing dehydrogenase
VIAANEREAEAFWALRDGISAPNARLVRPCSTTSRCRSRKCPNSSSPPPADRSNLCRHRAVAFGHLGDGNVHFHVLAPARRGAGFWEETEGKAISAQVYDW